MRRVLAIAMKSATTYFSRGAGESWRVDNQLRVMLVSKNGQAVDPAVVDDRLLVLGPRDECRVRLELAAINETGKVVPIPNGTYKIGATLTLMSATDTTRSRIAQVAPGGASGGAVREASLVGPRQPPG